MNRLTRSFLGQLFHIRVLHVATLLLPWLALPAHGQAVPNVQGASSYEGFHLPTVGGTLSYGITLSGDVTRGYNVNSGTSEFAAISGDLAFLSRSKIHPFSMVYSGGYFASFGGNAPSSVFQNLALSQVLTRGRWNYTVADTVSYLPQTANTGLSGVPGVGDTGVAPVDVGTGTAQGVLTDNAARVNNTTIGSVQRRLTASTSIAGTGSYTLARFLDSSSTAPGLNSNQYTAGANLSHRIDARNTVGGGYSFFHSAYPGTADSTTDAALGVVSSFSATSITFNAARQVNRRLSVFASVGPQWTTTPTIAAAGTNAATGTSVNVTIDAGASYSSRAVGGAINYFRGSTSGSGVVTGAHADSFQASTSRRLTRVWNGSASFAYTRSTSLVALADNPFVSDTVVGSGQVNRAIGRHLSAYGSYTALHQSTGGLAATSNVFGGLSQTVAFGLTYSPGVIGLGRR